MSQEWGFLWSDFYSRGNVLFIVGKDWDNVICKTEARLILANLRGTPPDKIEETDSGIHRLCGKSVRQLYHEFNDFPYLAETYDILRDLEHGNDHGLSFDAQSDVSLFSCPSQATTHSSNHFSDCSLSPQTVEVAECEAICLADDFSDAFSESKEEFLRIPTRLPSHAKRKTISIESCGQGISISWQIAEEDALELGIEQETIDIHSALTLMRRATNNSNTSQSEEFGSRHLREYSVELMNQCVASLQVPNVTNKRV